MNGSKWARAWTSVPKGSKVSPLEAAGLGPVHGSIVNAMGHRCGSHGEMVSEASVADVCKWIMYRHRAYVRNLLRELVEAGVLDPESRSRNNRSLATHWHFLMPRVAPVDNEPEWVSGVTHGGSVERPTSGSVERPTVGQWSDPLPSVSPVLTSDLQSPIPHDRDDDRAPGPGSERMDGSSNGKTPRATRTNPRANGTNPRAVAAREREQTVTRRLNCPKCYGSTKVNPTDDAGNELPAEPCPDCRPEDAAAHVRAKDEAANAAAQTTEDALDLGSRDELVDVVAEVGNSFALKRRRGMVTR